MNSTRPLPGSSPSVLRARFERLLLDLASVNAEEARAAVTDGVGELPVVQALLERLGEALELHGDTFSLYDNAGSHGPSTDPRKQQKLADLAFMAIAELRQIRERIEQSPRDLKPAAAASIIDDAVRRIRTSLSSVMGLLCDLEDLESPRHFATELAASLVVRKAYARLRRTITNSTPPLESRIRASKIEISVLRGRPFFPSLSVDDREAIIRLHERAIAWLRLPDGEEKSVDGERVWTDLCGVGNELGKIHLRQELVQHDRQVLRFVEEALTTTTVMDPALLDQLHDLEGVSTDLDHLLAQRTPEPSALLAVARELRETRYRDSILPDPAEDDMSGSWSGSWSNSWIQ